MDAIQPDRANLGFFFANRHERGKIVLEMGTLSGKIGHPVGKDGAPCRERWAHGQRGRQENARSVDRANRAGRPTQLDRSTGLPDRLGCRALVSGSLQAASAHAHSVDRCAVAASMGSEASYWPPEGEASTRDPVVSGTRPRARVASKLPLDRCAAPGPAAARRFRDDRAPHLMLRACRLGFKSREFPTRAGTRTSCPPRAASRAASRTANRPCSSCDSHRPLHLARHAQPPQPPRRSAPQP